MKAVVFDLFGTLVTAPSPDERSDAAARLAARTGRDPAEVLRYFCDTWQVRHDGSLATLTDLATHLVRYLGASTTAVTAAADELAALAQRRLIPDASVARALKELHNNGIRIGVLSDASAEIAAAWVASPLSALADAAVFSCAAGAVKPDQRLYTRIRAELEIPARHVLYVGDGGGDELRGATDAQMLAVGVRCRGAADALAFNATDWDGLFLDRVEDLPHYLAAWT